MVGGTGIEPCPLQEKCSVFKEFQRHQASVHNPFIKAYRLIRLAEEEKKIKHPRKKGNANFE